MATKSETLETLKKLTKENIENKKDFGIRIPKQFATIGNYYEKYLQKSIALQSVNPETIAAKEKGGNPEQDKFNNAPVHHKNTLLVMAFSKAEKLFTDIKGKAVSKEQEIFTKNEIEKAKEKAGERGDNPISLIECLIMSGHLLQGKNSSLIKSIKRGEMNQVNEFTVILNTVYSILKELRNYHAHILHEPGPLKFENLYGEYSPGKKPKKEDWDAAKNWFKNRMDEVKQHRIKSLIKQLAETSINENERKDIQDVLNRIRNYEFEKDGYVTPEALLFIACMFLRKGDAEYFVKKWTGLKKQEGAFRITQTFFTYYSTRDKKSLQTQNADLLKFRQIIGILSTMPEFKNNCFTPFNKFIKEWNNEYGLKSEKLHYKNDEEKWNNYCIPLRKNFNPTKWYLDYLNNKGYLNDFTIACYKSPEERLKFLEDNHITKGISDLKIEMKRATGDKKRELTRIYKESKKNFLFKAPSAVNDNYCIKNENAIIRYSFKDDRCNANVTVQANLSCDLLMKWAFADIMLGKGEDIKRDIKSFISSQYYALKYGKYNTKGVILPPSIAKAVDNPELNYSVDKARQLLNERVKQLNAFQKFNKAKKAPWKFGAKKKMDIIFEYAHLAYTRKALAENKDIDLRRHEALSDGEYLDAMELIRFYGKNYDSPEFKKMFFDDKKIYFHGITGCLAKSKALEELYNAVFLEFLNFYKETVKNLSEQNLAEFINLFKPRVLSNKANVTKHASLFATNQVVLHELINLQELMKDREDYKKWKEGVKDPKRTTDFSLIRYCLSKRNGFDTNSDFMMKGIMPVLLKKNLLPKNERGTMQGTTSFFNTLMKNKTDELMMWEIAKKYWENTYGVEFVISRQNELVKGFDMQKTPYKENLFFHKLFKKELILPLGGKNGEDKIEIKISPKKFDDEFQYYETQQLYTYIKNYQPVKRSDNCWHFEDLNKTMKDSIAKYLDDVFLLMTVEKKVVLENYEELTKILQTDSDSVEWEGFQFVFGNARKNADNAINKLGQMVLDKIKRPVDNFTLSDLIIFRNNILHQQIDPKREIYLSIKKALFNDYLDISKHNRQDLHQ